MSSDEFISFSDLLKEAQGQDKNSKDVPGLDLHSQRKLNWKIRLQLFDLTNDSDVIAIENLYTSSANYISDPNQKRLKSGIKILKETGQFFDNGIYKIMVQWGEWNVENLEGL